MNKLYLGDNLEILCEINDEYAHLIRANAWWCVLHIL